MSKYKHECWDWDGLEIDETCPEFVSCECWNDKSDVSTIKEQLKKDYYD